MKDIEVTPLGINKTRVDVQWDITVKVFFGLFRGRVKEHIPHKELGMPWIEYQPVT